MVKEVIGACACPECGGAAEIKRAKSGLAYRWCLDCHAQYFPRSQDASDRLVASLPGAKPDAGQAQKPEVATSSLKPVEQAAKPAAKPKAKAFDLLGQFA